MRPARLFKLIALGLAALLLAIPGSCVVSDLSNGFDMKGPRSLLMLFDPGGGCRFDEGQFDSCQFGR